MVTQEWSEGFSWSKCVHSDSRVYLLDFGSGRPKVKATVASCVLLMNVKILNTHTKPMRIDFALDLWGSKVNNCFHRVIYFVPTQLFFSLLSKFPLSCSTVCTVKILATSSNVALYLSLDVSVG